MTGNENLGLEVKRDPSEVAKDLIPRRNEKVEKNIDFPTAYKARVYAEESSAEHAFNEAYSSSTIEMTPLPGGTGSLEDIAEMIHHTTNSDADLNALVQEQYRHAPVLQDGIEALEDAGYNPQVEVMAEYSGNSIEETLNGIEETGATAKIWINDGPQDLDLGYSFYTTASYNAQERILDPNVQVAFPDQATEDEASRAEQDLRDILEDAGLTE